MGFRQGGGSGGSPPVAAEVTSLVWRPGAVSDPPCVYGTWLEVYAAIVATECPVVVYVDTSLGAASIPAGVYDLGERVTIEAYRATFGFIGPPTVVDMADGAVLHRLSGLVNNVRLVTNQTGGPALTFGNFDTFHLAFGAVLDNQGTGPSIEVADGEALSFGIERAGTIGGNTPAINLAGTATMPLFCTAVQFLNPDVISGDAGSTLIYLTDDTFDPPVLSAFLGTYGIDFRGSRAARATPAAGDTASRPAGGIPFGPLVGQMYFDIDFGQAYWWDGVAWVSWSSVPEGLDWSIVDYLSAAQTFVINAGSWTVGMAFNPLRPISIEGVRFYWAGAVARTIKGVLRDGAGTVLASATVAVAGAGIYQVTFAAPVAIGILNNVSYKISVWEISGTEYTRYSTTPTVFPNIQYWNGSIAVKNNNAFAAGDANPTGSGVEFFAVEPVISP